MNVYDKLLQVQSELKAEKGQLNKFGNYKYRSLEDIFEALKPHLRLHGLLLKLDNEMEVFNGALFRKSIATVTDIDSLEKITSQTYTQESITKKGMSAEQCSGSTASYGDKYVCNKLFLIDDTKDDDATNTHDSNTNSKAPKGSAEPSQKDLLESIKAELNRLTDDFKDTDSLVDIYKMLGVENFNQIVNNTKETKKMALEELRGMK
jgi:hypothetical protein